MYGTYTVIKHLRLPLLVGCDRVQKHSLCIMEGKTWSKTMPTVLRVKVLLYVALAGGHYVQC